MGFLDIENNRALCLHTIFLGCLTFLGFVFASIKPDDKDIYLLVGMGAMILWILSLYQLRSAYTTYYDYMQVSQTERPRESKVWFSEPITEEEEETGVYNV
jgi:hypothetical protein